LILFLFGQSIKHLRAGAIASGIKKNMTFLKFFEIIIKKDLRKGSIMQARWMLSLAILISSTLTLAHNQNHTNHLMRKAWTKKVSIKTPDFSRDLKRIAEADLDIAGVDIKESIIDILITDLDFATLKSMNLDYTIDEVKGITAGPDDEYKNPQEIEDFVIQMNNTYPKISKLISIGKSLEGRDIWALKISDNADRSEKSEPSVLFNSMHHAREVMTPEMGIDIIEYLLSNYATDSQVKAWVDTTEIWVIPMFNVDGNNKMWNEDAWWRKNTRGGFGVDLNRNYPEGWNSCQGSSGMQDSQTYRGPNPASEPETQAMMNFIATHRPVFDISYHSFSRLVIYPYGCKDKRTQTKEVVEKIGIKIAELVDYEPGTAWELLYNADGGDIDWMYAAYDVIPYVIELNSRWQGGFHPKYRKHRDKTVKRNRPGWMYLLDRVHTSGVRGKITMRNSKGERVPLSNEMIEVYKADGSLFQDYKTHADGTYHIVLNPGDYTIKVGNHVESIKIASTLNRVNISL
jgi:carboxypeptidase T